MLAGLQVVIFIAFGKLFGLSGHSLCTPVCDCFLFRQFFSVLLWFATLLL